MNKLKLFINRCFILINTCIDLSGTVFSITWIVWVLIIPFSALFGINQVWIAPASKLIFPGVCSAGQPFAGWPKSAPGWVNSCAVLQPPLLPQQRQHHLEERAHEREQHLAPAVHFCDEKVLMKSNLLNTTSNCIIKIYWSSSCVCNESGS